MTLLYIFAFLLLCIALNQVFKVVELARDLKNTHEWHPSEKDNRFNARLMLVFVMAFMAFFAWQVSRFGGDRILPVAASEHGVKIDWLLNINYALIIFVFVVTNLFLFVFAWKYYGRNNVKATYYHHNNKLEMLWTVIPAIALAFIIVFGLKYWNEIMARDKDENPIKVELYVKQFDWTARYAGNDNQFGVDDYMQIDGSNPVGLDTNDARCKDDILVKNEFHIPKGKEVVFQFRSRDVIHSAYMPHFRAQMNCVPGQVTHFRFKPTMTTAEMRKDPQVQRNIDEINAIRVKRGDEPIEFDYVLLCNKICGASHYNMQMKIVVDEEKDYNDWIKKQKTFKTVAAK
ncbi:MAG: cytochrome c oxidase subunit II [Bacteroidia bacterium]